MPTFTGKQVVDKFVMNLIIFSKLSGFSQLQYDLSVNDTNDLHSIDRPVNRSVQAMKDLLLSK